MKQLQRTTKSEATFSGIGVNTGEKATLGFKAAPANTGIVFVRTDLPGRPEVPATVEFAGNRLLRTSIVRDNVEVQMVEHVLRDGVSVVGFWKNAIRQEELRGRVFRFLDDNEIVEFDRCDAVADRLMELAKANHGKLLREE